MKKSNDTATAVFTCLGAIVVIALLCLVTPWALWAIWNALVPVFHWHVLTFWQACLVCVLLSIVGGFFKSSTSKS